MNPSADEIQKVDRLRRAFREFREALVEVKREGMHVHVVLSTRDQERRKCCPEEKVESFYRSLRDVFGSRRSALTVAADADPDLELDLSITKQEAL